MQASGDVAASRRKKRDQPSADADMCPQQNADGESNKKYGKNAGETGEKAVRAPRAQSSGDTADTVYLDTAAIQQ